MDATENAQCHTLFLLLLSRSIYGFNSSVLPKIINKNIVSKQLGGIIHDQQAPQIKMLTDTFIKIKNN